MGDLIAKGDKRLFKTQGEGVRVFHFHALDQAKLWRQAIGGPFPGNGGEGDLDILRGHLPLAPVEGDAFAQVEAPGAPAIQHLPPLCQQRAQLAGLGVTTQQVFIHRLEDDVLGPDIELG